MGFRDKIGLGRSNEVTELAREEAPKFERVTWHRDPGLKELTLYAVVLCASSMGTGYDGMYLNSAQNFETWKTFFNNPSGHDLGILTALYQVGSVCSIPMVPFVADKWGRKPAIAAGFVIMAVGAALQGGAMDYGTFAGGRVLLGFGNSWAQMGSPMLLTELCHPQHRARFTTVYNCLWNLGALIVAWLCVGTSFWSSDWNWRFPAIMQGVPGLIQLMFLWWMPESPRYLIAKDRHDEALRILAKYHANGNADHPTVQFEFREIRDTIKLEQAADSSTKYIDFFRSRGNRYRLMVLIALGIFSQWSGNAIISNYSARLYTNIGVSRELDRLGLGAGTTSMSMIVSITFALMVERVNRRFMFLLATSGMFVCLAFWTLACGLYEQHRAPGADIAMIFFIWLFQFFYSTAWSGLLIGYAVELLPYSLRAKGLMILNIAIQVALLLNTYLNPVAFEAWKAPPENEATGYGGTTWYLYLIYTIWVGGELAFVYFMFVETRGPTLEELVKVIDGPDAHVADIDMGRLQKDLADEAELERVATEDRGHPGGWR